ncbi:MAG: S9 family peptidase [Acidobacteria bacterium]|nr:S9 family peptidase [Acidobacteriota bacterium]
MTDGSIRALTRRKGPDTSPSISPDGKQIAYIGFDDAGLDYQLDRLYVMNRDGSGVRLLSGDLNRDVQRPRWAPDGSGIYVAYDDRGTTKLGLYSLDGKLRDVATDLGGSHNRAISLVMFSVAGNGNFAFTYSRPHIPSDVAVGSATGTARVVTSINLDLFAAKALGEVEEFWYPSALDGRKIQGWVMKPPQFDPTRKYPLILEIHGGPLSHYGPRFDLEKQFMAAAGYVVFYPNWRGSTSFGYEFAHLIEKVHPGLADDSRNPGDVVDDMMSGIDALIGKGYVDPENLFVTGGSGGGTLTMWLIARTNRFRAAVPWYPSGANWYSFVLYADRPSLVKYRFPGIPWEHSEHYMKRSPISIIKNVKTPTMILTGEEDYLTPMANSEEYYFALKWLNVETVLVRFPDEPHGIARHPSHHMTKILYTLSWFDQHKKGKGAASSDAGERR